MKRFFHPYLKNETVSTSMGKIRLDANGSAEVDDKLYDILMSIPEHAEHQKKLEVQEKIGKGLVPTLDEYVSAGYPAEMYEERFKGFKAGDVFDEEQIRKNQDAARKEAEEEKRNQLTVEDLKILDPKELRAIAKKHKVAFTKDTTPEELITSIIAQIKKPPEQPVQ